MVNDVISASLDARFGEAVTNIENLPERVKKIMMNQPLNPFTKVEVRVLPRALAANPIPIPTPASLPMAVDLGG